MTDRAGAQLPVSPFTLAHTSRADEQAEQSGASLSLVIYSRPWGGQLAMLSSQLVHSIGHLLNEYPESTLNFGSTVSQPLPCLIWNWKSGCSQVRTKISLLAWGLLSVQKSEKDCCLHESPRSVRYGFEVRGRGPERNGRFVFSKNRNNQTIDKSPNKEKES